METPAPEQEKAASAPRPARRRRVIAAAVACVAASLAVVPACVQGPSRVSPPIRSGPAPATPLASVPAGRLRVMTLNLAHGRGDGFHQAFTSRATIESKLENAAAVIRREAPHVVALQEADGPSIWSGRFNHVATLSDAAGLPTWIRGEHVQGLGLSYGTAMISRLALDQPLSVTFAPTWPTFPKGFVIATVPWPGRPGLEVDVVSVHLDFASRRAREGQARQLVAALSSRSRPRILMGDFNCQWSDSEQTLRLVADGLDVKPWQPDASDLVTFPKLGKRLDWILVSPSLRVVTHQVLPDVVSDHRGVIADLEVVE